MTGESIKCFEDLSGRGSFYWNGTNESNYMVANGIYFAVLSGSSKILSMQKLILLK
jgi:hypothetical protein